MHGVHNIAAVLRLRSARNVSVAIFPEKMLGGIRKMFYRCLKCCFTVPVFDCGNDFLVLKEKDILDVRY